MNCSRINLDAHIWRSIRSNWLMIHRLMDIIEDGYNWRKRFFDSFPIVIVEKKNSNDRIRMAVIFRKLNAVMIKDAFPMLDVDAILRVSGKKYVSTIDLTKCYYQIPLRKGDEIKTAFRTHRGLYHYKVMAFGIATAPATCHRLINKILNGLQDFAMAHLDEICIFTFSEHLIHIHEVMDRLLDSVLKANKNKCEFGMTKLKLFGHIVEEGTLKPDPEKTKVILEYPIPKTKKHLRSFMGLASYYRKYVASFGAISKPWPSWPRNLVPNESDGRYKADAAFNTLKQKLTSEPILMAPNSVNKEKMN